MKDIEGADDASKSQAFQETMEEDALGATVGTKASNVAKTTTTSMIFWSYLK